MRRVIFLTGLALAVGALVPASALPAAGGSDLPVGGTSSGLGDVNLSTGQGHTFTTGPFSHFGLTTVEQHSQLVPTGPTSFTFTSTWTATAANGDEMHGTSVGTGTATDPTHSTFQGTYTSTGGTGRFADASMVLLASIHATQISLVGPVRTDLFEVTAVGTLSY
jgi:hypothetical protein